MTYLYYKTSSTGTIKPNEKTINQWKHLSEKKNENLTEEDHKRFSKPAKYDQ